MVYRNTTIRGIPPPSTKSGGRPQPGRLGASHPRPNGPSTHNPNCLANINDKQSVD